MPKAVKPPRAGAATGIIGHKPYARSRPGGSNNQTLSAPSKSKAKDPKQSHLYTDDNPSTTLHGTGFKDAETAHRTLSLVSQRSLTYQWQVINTMYYRAKGHPSMKKEKSSGGTEGIKAAMSVFKPWLETTYPEAKKKRQDEGREFKPLLKKEIVARYMDRIIALESDPQSSSGDEKDVEDSKRFAKMYADLPKGKRLANLLLDDAHPEREDWEIRRETVLTDLRDRSIGEGEEGFWNENGGVSEWHLRCIAWAWSPVGERRLPP